MRSPQETPVTIAGYISADGSILYTPTPGLFTSTKTGAGSYVIRFTPPFMGNPVALGQIHNTHQWLAVTTVEPGRISIATSATAGGAGADLPFMFIAIGVRRRL